jgi:hypothetical protein
MVEFFRNLPWWIQYPGKAIAAISGGYVSNHPEIFPSWAVLVGATVALWVVLAFLWHALNALREHRGKTRLRLDPNLIIIVCLAAALSAAIWQRWRGSPSVHQDQVATIAKGPPPAPAQIATASEIPGIPPTKAGLSYVLDTILPKISDAISSQGIPARNSLRAMPGEAISSLVLSGHGGRDAGMARVKESIDALTEFRTRLSSLQDQNKLNSELIAWIIGDIQALEGAINGAIGLRINMGEITLPPVYNPHVLVAFWQLGRFSEAHNQVQRLSDWISTIESRAQRVQSDFGKRVTQ